MLHYSRFTHTHSQLPTPRRCVRCKSLFCLIILRNDQIDREIWLNFDINERSRAVAPRMRYRPAPPSRPQPMPTSSIKTTKTITMSMLVIWMHQIIRLAITNRMMQKPASTQKPIHWNVTWRQRRESTKIKVEKWVASATMNIWPIVYEPLS